MLTLQKKSLHAGADLQSAPACKDSILLFGIRSLIF